MTPLDRHRRFFVPKSILSDAELKASTHVDYGGGFALAAVSRATDRIVGCGQFFAMDAVGGCVEAAVVVLDSHKGSGLGSLLVDLLFRAAIVEFGVGSLHIEHLATNKAVRRVFDKAAARHATSSREHPIEDGVASVTWTLKAEVDAPPAITERLSSTICVDELGRKFEVSRPAAHPLSLWRYSLRMLVPHEGQMKTLSVRPVTPDDEAREAAFLRTLGANAVMDLHGGVTVIGGQPAAPADNIASMARAQTHFNFVNTFAIAAVDARCDVFVGVARWEGTQATAEVRACLAVVEAWKHMGVGSFLFDVLVQSAINEGKRRLRLQAPEDFAEVARQIVARHATGVSSEDAGGSPSGSPDKLVAVEAVLKPVVDKPTVLTRLPGAGTLADAEAPGERSSFSEQPDYEYLNSGLSDGPLAGSPLMDRRPSSPPTRMVTAVVSLRSSFGSNNDEDDVWGY